MATYGYDEVRDFPDLNKCPDCETFFADLRCPLCGKECPEEMRAGNRKPVKPEKRRRRESDSSRVLFIPWYHTTWFIVLMCFLQPIVGLILVWTSHWRKGSKVLASLLMASPYILAFLVIVMGTIGNLFWKENVPVNLELERSAYVELCETVDPETLYRNAEDYVDEYLSITLVVDAVCRDELENESEYVTYYRCHAESEGREWTFLVRDWRQEERVNLAVGDVIRVWGQGGGNMEIYNTVHGEVSAPGIHMLYVELCSEAEGEILFHVKYPVPAFLLLDKEENLCRG